MRSFIFLISFYTNIIFIYFLIMDFICHKSKLGVGEFHYYYFNSLLLLFCLFFLFDLFLLYIKLFFLYSNAFRSTVHMILPYMNRGDVFLINLSIYRTASMSRCRRRSLLRLNVKDKDNGLKLNELCSFSSSLTTTNDHLKINFKRCYDENIGL